MKVRQDAWTDEDDLLLAETVLRHVREGSTQLNAFEEVGDKLNRTSAACGFRWNAVVRHRYEKALSLAKKQRKQKNRILGKEQGGKKKLLYNPPVPAFEEIETMVEFGEMDMVEPIEVNQGEPVLSETTRYPMPTEQPTVQPQYVKSETSPLSMDMVIRYLQNLGNSSLQREAFKIENERLSRENRELKKHNAELEAKIEQLEKQTDTVQEDYETLMKIMNRARKLVLFEEEERPATKFKMDRNGNLEKVAE
ncbi:RsfA family transcriptional regulator [Bacillus sp. CGMCC 1.16607]|uniref:RsfA family transcriptional regulator n=1 Tax=Bacillus sp. CGMCC 1.16607 TaxID=3351842 RepID=UPI00362E924F